MKDTSIHHAGHDSPTAGWIVGRDALGPTRYLLHTIPPAFVAKIAPDEDTGILSELSYAMQDGRSLYDFIWFDPAPPEPVLHEILAEAERVILISESAE